MNELLEQIVDYYIEDPWAVIGLGIIGGATALAIGY